MLNGRFVEDLMGFYTFLHDSNCSLSTIDYILTPESIFYKINFSMFMYQMNFLIIAQYGLGLIVIFHKLLMMILQL